MADANAVALSQAGLDELLRDGRYGPAALIELDTPSSPELQLPPIRDAMPRHYRLVGRSDVVVRTPEGGRCGGLFTVTGSARLRARGPNGIDLGSAAAVDVTDTTIDAWARSQVRCARSRVTAHDHVVVEAVDDLETAANQASRIEAANRCVVTLRGRSRCKPIEKVEVTAYDEAYIEAGHHPMYGVLRLHDAARCLWRGASGMSGTGDRFTIEADGTAQVDVQTIFDGEVTITARGRAAVLVRAGVARVTLYDDATADVGTKTQVLAHDRSRVVGRGTAKIQLFDQAQVDEQSRNLDVRERRGAPSAP